jgi:hypothetical protein
VNPPVEPELEDCCRSGCCPCVFDLYAEAMERYEAWLAAQPEATRRSREGGNPISAEQTKSEMGFARARE